MKLLHKSLARFIIRGFTLIEVMLVIVVLSIISVYAIKMVRTSSNAAVIQKAAAQAINIQQAVLAYYVGSQNSQSGLTPGWPANLTILVTQKYLPNNTVLCSPFVTSTAGSAPCYNYAEFTNDQTVKPTSPYFTLQITAPSADIATALAAKLPSAWLTNNNTTVNSAIPIPGATSNSTDDSNGWITSAGIISTQYSTYQPGIGSAHTPQSPGQIYLPECRSGYEGHFITSPLLASTMNEGGAASSGQNWQNMYVSLTGITNPNWKTANSPPYATLSFMTSEHEIHMLVYYITFCIKTGYWGSSNYDTWAPSPGNFTTGAPIYKTGDPSDNQYNPVEDSQTTSANDWDSYLKANGTAVTCDWKNVGAGCVQQRQPSPYYMYNH